MRYCPNCREYYDLQRCCVICPHEPLARPASLDEYGWKMPPEAQNAMDDAYRENNRDGIRRYLGHSNPLVHAYATLKLEALDLSDTIRNTQEKYEKDSQLDGNVPETWTEWYNQQKEKEENA